MEAARAQEASGHSFAAVPPWAYRQKQLGAAKQRQSRQEGALSDPTVAPCQTFPGCLSDVNRKCRS